MIFDARGTWGNLDSGVENDVQLDERACLSNFQMHNGPFCSEPMYLTNKNMVRKRKKIGKMQM